MATADRRLQYIKGFKDGYRTGELQGKAILYLDQLDPPQALVDNDYMEGFGPAFLEGFKSVAGQ